MKNHQRSVNYITYYIRASVSKMKENPWIWQYCRILKKKSDANLKNTDDTETPSHEPKKVVTQVSVLSHPKYA